MIPRMMQENADPVSIPPKRQDTRRRSYEHRPMGVLLMVLLLLCLGILPDIPAALSLNFHSRNHVKLKATSNFLQHWGYRAYSSQTAAEHDRARRTATVLRMVLTTPESIIEQASTEKLIDILIDESVRTSARRPIMMQFDPSSGWIWRRWKGTVFSETWISCVRNVIYALIVLYIYRATPRLQGQLQGFDKLWGQLLSVTTFTLTFFVNQSYALWRKCYELSRRLQGRLHDLDLSLSCAAARKQPSSPNEPSTYTSASRQLLDLVARYVRLFNLLTYASFTRSHRPILTPRGMRRLVERGLMTAQEREILIDAEIPATQRHNCILMWITRIFIEGRQAGHFTGGSGIEQQFMEKIHVIRSQYGAIGDELQGRMPLAYAHIVQVLVDCVLLMYPLMAFSSGMSPFLGVVGTGLLTTSYQGLFDLAKQFLDPYDNENYGKGEDPLCVDTLIAETNAGSLRWMYGFEQMPVSSQRIKDGELFDYLLPVRGYTVEELEKMESDRLQKEKEMKEKREREEAERIKAGEEARRKKEAEELESIAEEEALEGMLEVDRQKDVNVTAVDENPIKTKDRSKKQLARQVGENATVAAEQQPAKASNLTPSLAKKFARDSKQVPSISDSNTTENLPDSKPVIHRVTSLEGGLPVSLAGTTDNSQNVTQSNIPMISVPQSKLLARNATASKFEDINVDSDFAESKKEASPDIGSEAVDGSEQEEDLELVEEVQNEEDDELYVGFDSFQDLPWFDEVGPDGQEVRLSQLLAEEEWEEEKAYKEEKERITYEEFRMRSAEIVERAESEFLETEQIMMAAPGAQDGQTLLKEEKTLKTVMYDQTKLDGISQLWGLPPDDPDDIPGYEIPDTPVEESTFEGISYLWGRAPETPNDGTSSYIEEESFDGTSISELWGDRIDGSGDEEQGFGRSEDPSSHSWGDEAQYSDKYNERIDSNEEDYDLDSTIDSYGLPSWDDGSGDRLSQILADEMWEDEVADAPELDWESPITTLEEYEKKVAELSNEIKETEAILNAPPGADSTERDDDEAEDGETLEQSVDLQNSENQTDATEDWNDGDDDLDALGMDVSPTDVLPANSSIYNATDVTVLDPVPSEEITNTTKAKGDATLQNITIEDESSNDKADGDSDDAPIEGENHA